MKSFSIFILTFLLINIGYTQVERTDLNLMPYPQRVELTNQKFRLDDSFTVAVSGSPNERIYSGVTQMIRRLGGKTGIFFKQDYITKKDNSSASSMVVNCSRAGNVVLNENEAYQLTITPQKIEIRAETDLGALHGLETLLQLVVSGKDGYYFPTCVITDEPRFPWRGLMIDVCRHFLPIDVIKRNIDGMALVKMNVLHLHLTEDQGFRIESKVFPKLHQLGSDGLYFTQEQIREIIKYANERGIRVMPEFDLPGHASSWFTGYPELSSGPGPYSIERGFGVFNPTMDPTKEETYQFLDAFFKEMSALFPDEYIHIGGDENNGEQWNKNAEIQKFKQANNIVDNHGLQGYFNKRLLAIITKYGKKMAGWDEIYQPDLPNTILIQSWRGKEALVQSAAKGYPAILSSGYYIDLVQSTEFHYLNDPLSADANLTDAQRKNIYGGEATMWSELVTPENVDSRIWPRTAAIAERLWSPSGIKDVDEMYRRLAIISIELEEAGLTHEKNVDMFLRRMIQGKNTETLRTLVDVIEPVEGYSRHNQGIKFTSYSPYTRIADAARPDAETARNFRKLVDLYLKTKDKAVGKKLEDWLFKWSENHQKLLPVIEAHPILKSIESLSSDLSKLSNLGLVALNSLYTSQKLDSKWIANSTEIITQSKKPRDETELVIVEGIEKLVKAVK